jgi:hypothetical protein
MTARTRRSRRREVEEKLGWRRGSTLEALLNHADYDSSPCTAATPVSGLIS